jgi:uncharacterized protein (DUF305 family)
MLGNRLMRILLLVALASVVFGCDSDDHTEQGDPVSPPPIPANDVQFIDSMAPHHQLAIDMADQELARGASADVKEMAATMRQAQLDEIQDMESIRQQLTGTALQPVPQDPHGERDMSALAELSGVELDRAFLDNMIPHHAGAVQMAHRALPNLENAQLQAMAHDTIANQTREMSDMLDMRERL